MSRYLYRSLALIVLSLCVFSIARAAILSPSVYIPLAIKPGASSNDFVVSTATYLGATGADSVSAVDIAPDGNVLVAGVFPGYIPAGSPVVLEGGSTGAVVRLTNDGTQALGITRVGSKINDMEVAANGAIIVCGDFGLAQLSADATEQIWRANPGEGKRCAVGSDGTVAVIANGSAYTYDSKGNALRTWAIGGSSQSDIAVDGASETVVAVGYTQKDVAGACDQLKSPFARAWNYLGEVRWENYNASAQASNATGQCADSEVVRASMGRDGKLYLAGTSDGGNSVFARDPKDVTQSLGARQVKTDKYNDPFNLSGAKKITWYGRYAPANGQIELGQFLLTRLDDNKGNSIDPRAITAAADGTVYVVGSAYYRLAERDAQNVAGIPVGAYEGGEAYLLVVSPDMKTRLRWTPFAGPKPNKGGASPASAVAVRGQTAAIGITFNPGTGGRSLITSNALHATPRGNTDGYIAVWER